MKKCRETDNAVGQIAGAIYSDINLRFPHPPLMLVPSLTFKVKKVLEQVADLRLLSKEQRAELAKEIQIAIIPMLFSLEMDPDVIEQITPVIESAAAAVLMQMG